jgi:hypothetical protein
VGHSSRVDHVGKPAPGLGQGHLRNSRIVLRKRRNIRFAGRLAELKQARAALYRDANARPHDTLTAVGHTLAHVWSRCHTDHQRRDVLAGQIAKLTTHPGTARGRGLDESRIALTWKTAPALIPDGLDPHGPATPTQHSLPEWVSIDVAAQLTGLSEHTIRQATRLGHIERRHVHPTQPSLSRTSVLRFAETYQDQQNALRPWISFRTAAAILGCSTRAIQAAVDAGDIHQRPAGRPSLARTSVLALLTPSGA